MIWHLEGVTDNEKECLFENYMMLTLVSRYLQIVLIIHRQRYSFFPLQLSVTV